MQNFSQNVTYRSLLAKKQGKGFSEAEAKDILRQALSQLIRLHEQRQSHGSVSLDTVAYDPNRMQVALLAGNGINNPIYLAPEILQTRQATPSADIYALGVVMIVLLTGLPPEALKAPNNTWSWEDRCIVSDQFIQILNIALSSARDFRYVNAGQMLRALQPNLTTPQPQPTIINPAIATPPNQSLIPLSYNPSVPQTSIPSELASSESLNIENTEANYSHKIDKLKAELPNSATYRKATTSKDNLQKTNGKSKLKIFLAILSGVAITVGGLGGAYFYMQFKSSEAAKQNLEFGNALMTSVNSEIARIYEENKANENSEKLITLAKDKYENAGNLAEVTTILQAIPKDNPIRPKADQLLAQWQEETKKNNDLILKAEQAAKDGKWQLAIDILKDVAKTPYWQQRQKKITDNAKEQLDKKIVAPAPVNLTVVPPVSEAPPSSPEPPVYQEPPPSYSSPPQEAPAPADPPSRPAPPSGRDAN